jgi:malonate transporter and related proteins
MAGADAMRDAILGSLLPVVITFLLGFVAAWRSDFRRQDASILNRLVLTYALPLMLFVGTVSTPRAQLSQSVPLVIALCVAIVGLYAAVFLASRVIFAARTGTSALAALTASAPAVPFMAPAILGELFGQASAIPIAVGSLVINLTVVPATILFLALDPVQGDSGEKNVAAQDGKHVLPRSGGFAVAAAKLGETIREPLVWAPVAALAVVLSGCHVPSFLLHALSLLGHASGGVSLFAAGIVLASGTLRASSPVMLLGALKDVVQPALVLGGLRWLGYGNPILREAVLTTAIPAMPIVAMLALQYRVAEAVAASALFFSVVGSVITLAVFIVLTS